VQEKQDADSHGSRLIFFASVAIGENLRPELDLPFSGLSDSNGDEPLALGLRGGEVDGSDAEQTSFVLVFLPNGIL